MNIPIQFHVAVKFHAPDNRQSSSGLPHRIENTSLICNLTKNKPLYTIICARSGVYLALISLLLTSAFYSTSFAFQTNFNKKIEINELESFQLYLREFKLTSDSKIRINGSAFGDNRNRKLISFGWILNADTRNTVWKMDPDNLSALYRSRSRRVINEVLKYEESLNLPQGNYELYYIVQQPSATEMIFGSRGRRFRMRTWDEMIGRNRNQIPLSDLGITVWGITTDLKENDGYMQTLHQQSILSFAPVTNNMYYGQGFSVTKATDVRIYALGEFATYEDTGNDFGWIIDAETKEKIWEMKRSQTSHAGGGEKNRKFDQVITLPAGEYVAYYVSDGSHAFNDWNVPSPYDPYYWGLSIFAAGPNTDLSAISLITETVESAPFLSLVRIGNDAIVSQGFNLKEQADLRFYSVGESDYSIRNMADFGWVINADNRSLVWKMNTDATEWAGGHSKNRMYDKVLTFEPGNYIVYYRTDDSHSYNNWNEQPPYDPDSWGITVHLADVSLDSDNISLFNPIEYNQQNILVSINQTMDNARIKKVFSLDQPLVVRIYALGEGQYGRLVDYGWIENENDGRTVWEMSYNITENAGGASKNRIFYDEFDLDIGTYSLHYVTDGSHSNSGWNDQPPYDPLSWGITLFIVR